MNKKRGILVLILFLLSLGLGGGILESGRGCYLDLNSNNYCKAISVSEAGDANRYYERRECTEFAECELVTCSLGCEQKALGKCQALGGIKITEEIFSEWCSPGCCKTGKFCEYIPSNAGKGECLEIAKRQGLGESQMVFVSLVTDPEMNPTKCGSEICSREISALIFKGCLLDETGSLITGAGEIRNEVKATVNGCFEFQLNPGTYTLKVSAEGYVSQTKPISLTNQPLAINFTLLKAKGTVELNGNVKDELSNQPIEGAVISWQGETEGSTVTNQNGYYKAEGLVLGKEYRFIAAKRGYSPAEERITLTFTGVTTQDFKLKAMLFQGISGYIWLDHNNDDRGDEKMYGARIYVDGAFRGESSYDNKGYYEISLEPGSHEIRASWEAYETKEKFAFTLATGEIKTKDLVLNQYFGECSASGAKPRKNIEEFSASHILGEKGVRLEWKKPCPEVIGYLITKFQGQERIKEWSESAATVFYSDKEVDWGKSYTYRIIAVYDETRQSEKPASAAITLGDKECEGKYDLTGRKTFCLVEPGKRSKVWTCSNENKLSEVEDCSSIKPGLYFCSQLSGNRAACKDATECGSGAQKAEPFGLYYQKQNCYGVAIGKETIIKSEVQSYCYFDYADTSVNKCGSCEKINTCYGYQSQEACELNNCLGAECRWIEPTKNINLYAGFENILVMPVTWETGHGYCTEKDYQKEDKCSLCSPQAEVFENYYCTAEVCSGLGRCFSNKLLTSCETCGKTADITHNCYTYGSEAECTGGQPLVRNSQGEITLSKDRCGWGRCVWKGTRKSGQNNCVKDGDGDGKEDCESLHLGEQPFCRIDNQAPETKIIPEGVKIVSYNNPTLTFQATDKESRLGVLEYCLASAEANTPLCSDFSKNSLPYPKKQKKEELKVNLLNSSLKEGIVSGQTYRLRYYSKDEYSNQEQVKEAFVFIDNQVPQFEIKEEISTVADTTNLKVYLTGLNEPMKCGFELKPILPQGQSQKKNLSREQKAKEAIFSGLKGVIYDLTVSCVDDYSNTNNQTKKYILNKEQRILIKYPPEKRVINKQEFAFEIETLVGANCELYKTLTEERITYFNTSETGKQHKTRVMTGFIQGNYAGVYKAVCQELLNRSNVMEKYFDFAVDLFGPSTQIILTEGNRTERPTEKDWEKSFVKSVQVSFECRVGGLSCDKTYYCLGEGCEYPLAPGYVLFNNRSLNLNKSQTICYYSSDAGGSRGYPVCGKILIEGYGIRLVKPELYWYEGEQWGVSNQLIFDWEILTKIPTIECKFDFVPNFNYENTPNYKLLLPGEKNHYLFKDFPGSFISAYDASGGLKIVYAQCKDLEGKIGPGQKINLEYDSTVPTIKEAYAVPNPINEGTETNLYVRTDDKTLCRYDEESAEYGTMAYAFPGVKNSSLEMIHQDRFKINFKGTNKTYNLRVQCKNGAGNSSATRNLTFLVDYSAAGNILAAYPSGYIRATNITLEVLTNKNALCQYNNTYFASTGGVRHLNPLINLREGNYTYLVSCLIEGKNREAKIEFIIDLTPPQISEISDGNFSCSLRETPNVYVYTNEGAAVGGYYYELYDRSNNSILVSNGTVNERIPFKIETELKENSTYYFKVLAIDKAGNVGAFKESEGFQAVSSADSRCEQDNQAPTVDFKIEDSCTSVGVEMHCQEETSCEMEYGQHSAADACEILDSYSGQKIIFEKTGWLCYSAEDRKGNNMTGNKKIEFFDEDGDGIADSCDRCEETEAGSEVDEEGCTLSDVKNDKDTDGDGLPDEWEQRYDNEECKLDYTDIDSDSNEVEDGAEDYDADSYNNYEEYKAGYEPCVADTPAKTQAETRQAAVTEEESNSFAWFLFIFGLLMVLGGSGYLVYYNKLVLPNQPAKPAFISKLAAGGGGMKRPLFDSWKEKILQLRRARLAGEKKRKREEVFSGFSQGSKEIPHIEKIIQKGGQPLRRVEEAASKYLEKKEEIKPGLRQEEKSIFSKLEKLGQQTQQQKIEEVISNKEAKTIFEQLDKISKKRKSSK